MSYSIKPGDDILMVLTHLLRQQPGQAVDVPALEYRNVHVHVRTALQDDGILRCWLEDCGVGQCGTVQVIRPPKGGLPS